MNLSTFHTGKDGPLRDVNLFPGCQDPKEIQDRNTSTGDSRSEDRFLSVQRIGYFDANRLSGPKKFIKKVAHGAHSRADGNLEDPLAIPNLRPKA